jgi:integrase/recombinase XerC
MSEPLPARVSPKALPALVAPRPRARFIDSLLRISATATHAKLRPRGQRTPALVRAHGVHSLAQVGSFHDAAWIEAQSAALTVKQRLTAIHHRPSLRLVGGQSDYAAHPASSVREPKHIMRKGKTPALEPTEARALLDSIEATTAVGWARSRADRPDGL